MIGKNASSFSFMCTMYMCVLYYECISCSEDDSIIEEFCGKGYKKSRMDRYDSVFEELEKGKVFSHACVVFLFFSRYKLKVPSDV